MLRHARSGPLSLVIAVLQVTAVVALAPSCSSSNEERATASSDDSVTTDTKKKDAGPPVCVASCISDDECQRTCPPVEGARTSCCDLATGMCYASRVDCPEPVDGGDDGGPAY